MSDNTSSENAAKHGEMHRIDGNKNTGVNLQRRDAELYIALGLFMFALGLPVILGTYFAVQGNDHCAAIVNFICGVVLAGIGAASAIYGWVSRKKLI